MTTTQISLANCRVRPLPMTNRESYPAYYAGASPAVPACAAPNHSPRTNNMRPKLHTSAAILLAFALAPLHAQEATPGPAVPPVPNGPHDVSPPVPPVPPVPPIPTHPVVPAAPPALAAPKTEKRTLVVAELRDIRFTASGSISFSDPSTGEIYSWAAPSGRERTPPAQDVAAAAAVLAELRRAVKVELVVSSSRARVEGDKDFRVSGMTLVYDSLK